MIRTPYLLAGALATGLASATALRFSLAPAALVLGLGVLRPRLGLACAIALAGWWWGSERLVALDRSVLAPLVGTAGSAIVDVEEPPRRGRYEVRVRALAVRFAGASVHEPLLLLLPGRRAPPQGARLRVLLASRDMASGVEINEYDIPDIAHLGWRYPAVAAVPVFGNTGFRCAAIHDFAHRSQRLCLPPVLHSSALMFPSTSALSASSARRVSGGPAHRWPPGLRGSLRVSWDRGGGWVLFR